MNRKQAAPNDEERGKRLVEERERLGLTQVEFSRLSGVSRGSQRLYEIGKSPTADYFAAISRLGVDICYVIDGVRKADARAPFPASAISGDRNGETEGGHTQSQITQEVIDQFAKVAKAAKDADAALMSEAVAILKRSMGGWRFDPDEFVRLPLFGAEPSTDHGATNDGESIGAHLLFRTAWIEKLGLSPKDAKLARAWGDSMSPLICDGDIVLVDQSEFEVPVRSDERTKPVLVAFEQEDAARLKWVERPSEDTLVVYSENSKVYGPEVYSVAEASEIRIIGRVVWWCHTPRW